MTGGVPPASPVLDILHRLETGGQQAYLGEPVTQLEHALQAAALAVAAGAPDSQVVAALLHDVGHLLHDGGEDVADRGIDMRHEALGHAWLTTWFGPAVSQPVRLHVDAKRCLCALDPTYLAALSPASRASLDLQGGPMSAHDARAFMAQPWAPEALALRRWDDLAKVPGLAVPDVWTYQARLEAQCIWR